MFATLRARNIALVLSIVALLVGTTIPGSLKAQVEGQLWHAWPWSATAHFLLFGLIAAIPRYGQDGWTPWRALVLAVALACVTEFLQFFVPGRHPLLRDGLIDLAGTAMGLAVNALQWKANGRANVASPDEMA